CNSWGSNTPEDISLNDYSGTYYNINSGGANRIRIDFTSVESDGLGFDSANISSVLKVLPSRQEVRYMNNLLVHKWE
ncbi:hypothetical protein CL614_07065, partial [archaeon]|nr:hypothetical protein [archaeon]